MTTGHKGVCYDKNIVKYPMNDYSSR